MKRISTCGFAQHGGRYRWTAHAMITIAAGDVITVDPQARSFFLESHIRSTRCEFVQTNVVRFVDDLSASRVERRIQVFGDCGLAIGHHGLTSEFFGVDKEPWPALPGNR